MTEQHLTPRSRPEVLEGTTSKFRLGCGNLYVTVNTEDGVPFEVFAQRGKAGACTTALIEGVARLISLALRSGVELSEIAKQIKGISCPGGAWDKGSRVNSCLDAIAGLLEQQSGEKQ